MQKYILSALITLSLIFGICLNANAADELYKRPGVQQFIDHMVKHFKFSRPELEGVFKQVKLNTTTTRRTKHKFEAVPWVIYKTHFITPGRIADGVKFWKKYQKTLERAQKEYGVPPQIIVAFLGIETKYGTRPGKIKVIDALSTLAFSNSPRAHFFRNQLVHFLLLSREQGFNPLEVRGSYAGAIGLPQFMPDSYRNFAVDFDNDHKADLLHSAKDAIGSIANFLVKHGWKRNAPIATPAELEKANLEKVKINTFKPKFTLSQLKRYGIVPRRKIQGNPKATVIELGLIKPTYWLGFNNFHVITRYNPDIKYAMTVYQLSNRIKALKTLQHENSE